MNKEIQPLRTKYILRFLSAQLDEMRDFIEIHLEDISIMEMDNNSPENSNILSFYLKSDRPLHPKFYKYLL